MHVYICVLYMYMKMRMCTFEQLRFGARIYSCDQEFDCMFMAIKRYPSHISHVDMAQCTCLYHEYGSHCPSCCQDFANTLWGEMQCTASVFRRHAKRSRPINILLRFSTQSKKNQAPRLGIRQRRPPRQSRLHQKSQTSLLLRCLQNPTGPPLLCPCRALTLTLMRPKSTAICSWIERSCPQF
jgi:hypothetical protein